MTKILFNNIIKEIYFKRGLNMSDKFKEKESEILNCIDDEIIKHNRIIESAFGGLTLNSYKLLMFLSAQFSLENMIETEDCFKLSFKNRDFLDSLEYSSQNGYTEVRKYLKQLKNTTIELPVWENDEIIGVDGLGFIDKYRSLKKGVSTIKIDKEMMKYIYKLNVEKENTILRYDLIKKFESYYSIRIYELLIRWKNSAHKKTTLELEALKDKLGVKGKYKAIKDFEQRVLKVAKREINQISDIVMDYKKFAKGEIKGKGRRPITHIEFTFKMKYEQDEKEILTDKQKDKLMEIARKKVIGSTKTAEEFYYYAFGEALQGVSNKNSKTAYFKYIERILINNQTFIGQTSMMINPEVRAAVNKKAEKRIEETRKSIQKQEQDKKNGVGMPEEIRKKLAEINKNYSFNDEE